MMATMKIDDLLCGWENYTQQMYTYKLYQIDDNFRMNRIMFNYGQNNPLGILPPGIAAKHKNKLFRSADIVIDSLRNVLQIDAHYGEYTKGQGYTIRHDFGFFGLTHDDKVSDVTNIYRL